MIDNEDRKFFERIKAHPSLKKRFEEIMNIAENTSGDIVTADEAEGKAIEEVQKLGKEIIREWAVSQHSSQAQQFENRQPDARKHVKKNSTGKPPLEE